jgi:16S rRNA A1518/A1519 N6-dimethyltransferase RsmA/KsgA/DIM1 with predicted DNA glycosylase/AP lyase activity
VPEAAEGFVEFAGLCFRQKRKTLRNNLSGRYPKDVVEQMAEGGLRAEQLSVEELVRLWRRLEGGCHNLQY